VLPCSEKKLNCSQRITPGPCSGKEVCVPEDLYQEGDVYMTMRTSIPGGRKSSRSEEQREKPPRNGEEGIRARKKNNNPNPELLRLTRQRGGSLKEKYYSHIQFSAQKKKA